VTRLSRIPRSTLGLMVAVVLGTALIAVLVVVAARSWAGGDGGTYAPPETLVSTRLDPPSALFGDRVEATARIVVDERVVDPRSIVLDPSFKPFQAFTSVRRVTGGVGDAAEVRFTFGLQCVTGECIRAMEEELKGGSVRPVPVTLPPATARGRTHEGARVTIPVTWPKLTVHSRLTADDIAFGEPTAPRFVAVDVDYGVSPGRLGWLLVALAVVLIGVAGVLVASVVAGRRKERVLRLPPHLGAVERSLALARHALDEGDIEGGRKALERLSAELERSGQDDLAEQVTRIAWSPPGPSEEELDDLTHLVGSSTNGR
jgi:hypothetical protein